MDNEIVAGNICPPIDERLPSLDVRRRCLSVRMMGVGRIVGLPVTEGDSSVEGLTPVLSRTLPSAEGGAITWPKQS